MPVDRPTFSESWYRVASLRPRLRSTVQVFRQHFRGMMWHVLQDPSNNQFFRLSDSAYTFVALLDGRRSVADAWRICNEQLGDAAPTQGEVIQLLGQLYTGNLLQAELPPDAEGLFNRYRKRVTREVQSYLMNLLFIRIPLFDPDHFLERWVGVVGWLFSWAGMLFWLALVATAGYFVVGRWDELYNQGSGVLDADNLVWLYLSGVVIKIIHEFGHGFACKKFGKASGSGGEVHVLGVMLLVFMPMPYVDASSAWAFRHKLHRMVVGAGGMLVEIAVAAIAAIVWANVTPDTPLHALAYNTMFLGSVTTVLFNANPLLRYDGYYMLSDLLEIPNLAQRAKQYLTYLVRKYAWGVRQARNPANTQGEKVWFVLYGVSSSIYRVFIVAAILLFIANKLFFVGMALAVAMVFVYAVMPLGKFLHYLATSQELLRVRPRAVLSTLGLVAAIVVGVGMIPAPDRVRIEGVVEPADLAVVYAQGDGFVRNVLDSNRPVAAEKDVLVTAENPDLETAVRQLETDLRITTIQRYEAQAAGRLAEAQSLSNDMKALERFIAEGKKQVADLTLEPRIDGRWVSPQVDRLYGVYLKKNQKIGMVASERMIIRATAGQDIAARIRDEVMADEANRQVEMRIKNRADLKVAGRIEDMIPAGQEYLPSAALGIAAGGSVPTAQGDDKGVKAAQRVFELKIAPAAGEVPLYTGQRVVVRVTMPPKPLAQQWWRSLLQLIQRRFEA